MLNSHLPSFFDELEKIATAGDLMTPAVVSDSAAVDGPPATAFPKRKPYKRSVGAIKEAADFKQFVQQSIGRLKRAPKLVQDTAAKKMTEGFVKAPAPIQEGVKKGTELLYRCYHQ